MSSEASDSELVSACLNGSRERFKQLFDKYFVRISCYVKKRIRDQHGVEDIVQEAFVRAYDSLKTCANPERFDAWLFGITRNCIRKWVEKNKGMKQIDEFLDEVKEDEAEPNSVVEERLEALTRGMSLLSKSSLKIINLKYKEGLSCKEIAANLSMPIGSVTRVLSEAYAKLAKILTPSLEEEK